MKLYKLTLLLAASLALFSCSKKEEPKTETPAEEKVVNVYTHRHYDTDKQLFDQFEKETGIKVNIINASADELITRMKSEGKDSPADVLITVDAGRLHNAKVSGLLQPVESAILSKNVPAHLKDADNYWYGITKRARIIAYDKSKVNPKDIATYWDLTKDKFKGKVLIRSSNNVYNQSLLASFIAHFPDSNFAELWAAGIVKNMARKPAGGDRDQIKAVAAGLGTVAVVNSYYFGKMANSDDPADKEAASKVAILFPNQDGRGTHINVSGAGVAKYSKHKENAIKFIEFLSSKEAQEMLSGANYEFPVNPEVEPSAFLQSWGTFKEDTINLSELGEYNAEAIKIFNKVGWH
jgi:iron(III) transport system substrate-binding protein